MKIFCKGFSRGIAASPGDRDLTDETLPAVP